MIEYVHKPAVDRKSDDRSLPEAANSADRGHDAFTGLQIGENDGLAAEHLESDDGPRNRAAVGQCEMFGSNPHGAIRVGETPLSVHGSIDGAPPAVDGKAHSISSYLSYLCFQHIHLRGTEEAGNKLVPRS